MYNDSISTVVFHLSQHFSAPSRDNCMPPTPKRPRYTTLFLLTLTFFFTSLMEELGLTHTKYKTLLETLLVACLKHVTTIHKHDAKLAVQLASKCYKHNFDQVQNILTVHTKAQLVAFVDMSEEEDLLLASAVTVMVCKCQSKRLG